MTHQYPLPGLIAYHVSNMGDLADFIREKAKANSDVLIV